MNSPIIIEVGRKLTPFQTADTQFSYQNTVKFLVKKGKK